MEDINMFSKETFYEFTEVELTHTEFNNLVFMGPPPIWRKYKDEDEKLSFLHDLCFKPLKDVVQRVMKRSRFSGKTILDPTDVFKSLNEQNIRSKNDDGSDANRPWFRDHEILCDGFKKEVMGQLWIRNLTQYEGGERTLCPDGSFYIEDGNHRALVYGVRLALDKENYEPVKALHATSWDIADGILGHPCQAADNLEHGGRFPTDGGINDSIKKRTHYYKSGFHAPIRRAVSF